jgi:predicted nuclease of predicted toxin-antitoxin system
LLVRFLLDMGVDVRVAAWLRDQTHEAVHLRDEGLQRLPNGEIFTKAISERRIILTFDLDFGEIAALARGRKASVVVFRLHNTRTQHVLDRLAAVLADCGSTLEKGAVVVVEETRHRVRLLPVGHDQP